MPVQVVSFRVVKDANRGGVRAGRSRAMFLVDPGVLRPPEEPREVPQVADRDQDSRAVPMVVCGT
jgi:hypothetical protein